MRPKELVWLGLLFLAVLLAIYFKYVGYLPGDVGITRLIQSILPESKTWAQVVSSTAEMPWVLGLIAATVILSWLISGWRASLLAVVCFIGLWLLGKWLGPAIGQPRPSPALVQVTKSLPGSAFPSIFAFNYAATVGYLAVLAAVKSSGKLEWIILIICSFLLIIGWLARVELAAHWPSDVGVSYLIGLLWVTLLMRFIE